MLSFRTNYQDKQQQLRRFMRITRSLICLLLLLELMTRCFFIKITKSTICTRFQIQISLKLKLQFGTSYMLTKLHQTKRLKVLQKNETKGSSYQLNQQNCFPLKIGLSNQISLDIKRDSLSSRQILSLVFLKLTKGLKMKRHSLIFQLEQSQNISLSWSQQVLKNVSVFYFHLFLSLFK